VSEHVNSAWRANRTWLLRPTREQSPLRSETLSAGYKRFSAASKNSGHAPHRMLAIGQTIWAKPLRRLCRAGRIASAMAQALSAANLPPSAKMQPGTVLQRLIKFQMKPNGAHLLLLQWLWELAFLSG
jgi:hypothetical protein